jgi:hypothetical protein
MRLAIGDMHGRQYWKKYLYEDFTEYYILGDYFDSSFVSFTHQYNNFKEICETAKRDNRIKLCLGNHDFHYLKNIPYQRYSGYQAYHADKIQEILEENISLLKILYATEDRYLLSHAGLSRTFAQFMKDSGAKGIEDINALFLENRSLFIFRGKNKYGNDCTQGPLWIRPTALESDPVAGFNQIVGHSPYDKISEYYLKSYKVKIVYIDTGAMESIYRF